MYILIHYRRLGPSVGPERPPMLSIWGNSVCISTDIHIPAASVLHICLVVPFSDSTALAEL